MAGLQLEPAVLHFRDATAHFGPALGHPNAEGSVVVAEDVVEPTVGVGGASGTTTDGCCRFSNPAAVAGNFVLMNAGSASSP